VQRIATYLLATLIGILLAMQARLLFVFPAPDSARWWGDETGQMLELRAELQSGYARIPTALGSSLEESNGLVRSNSWFAALIYGLPALAFGSAADVVSIGRTITFLLSIALCVLMFAFMRRQRVDAALALLAILLLISTRSFFYGSHAARLDVAVGISLLLFMHYLSKRYELLKSASWQPTVKWCFLYGAVAMLFTTLSIHLLTLLGILSIFVIIQFGIYRNIRLLLASMSGVAVVLAIMLAAFYLSGTPLTLFSNSIKPNQFQSVAGGLPILRPFSRSVQIANIFERLNGLWSEAPIVLIVATITITIAILFRRPQNKTFARQFWTRATVVILIAWLFFQSPAVYYYLHILPVVVIWFAILIHERIRYNSIIPIAIGVILSIVGIRDCLLAEPLANRIASNNSAAIDQCLKIMSSAEHPVVLAQNPAIARLEHASTIGLMTPHFLDFPVRDESSIKTMRRVGVRYMMLYAPGDRKTYSSDYAALRPLADSAGVVRARIPGILLDANRDYFNTPALEQLPKDTLILYELAR
jgi:hypothetical protein